LLKDFLKREKRNLIKNKIRLRAIGDIDWFPEPLSREINETIAQTSRFYNPDEGFTLILALNYGGRQDIVQACQHIIKDIQAHRITSKDVTLETFSRYLYTQDIPDPDLLIRTSYEYRISNFLLWQISYAELYITPVLWPDFTRDEFLKAIISFQNRERRFGLV
jgi:undecaprenyl diphosphate synthase